MPAPTLKPMSLKPQVETSYEVRMRCASNQAAELPVKLIENGSLHDCIRKVIISTFVMVPGAESHPQGELIVAAVGEHPAFEAGRTYKVRVEKDEQG